MFPRNKNKHIKSGRSAGVNISHNSWIFHPGKFPFLSDYGKSFLILSSARFVGNFPENLSRAEISLPRTHFPGRDFSAQETFPWQRFPCLGDFSRAEIFLPRILFPGRDFSAQHTFRNQRILCLENFFREKNDNNKTLGYYSGFCTSQRDINLANGNSLGEGF
jgi:hypothetical protein